MGNRVLYVVLCDDKKNKNVHTATSITEVLGKEDTAVFVTFKDEEKTEQYHTLKPQINAVVNDVNNFDYVCLIPNGSTVNSNTRRIFEENQADRDDDVQETYLPFVVYQFEKDEKKQTLIMNKHIWNSSIASTAGVLDPETALKQIDSTIFGAFIPVSNFFNPDFYLADLKYYQQYYLLNNLADNEKTIVLGIPKIIVTDLSWDFVLADIDSKEKGELFNRAREKWTKKSEKNPSEGKLKAV